MPTLASAQHTFERTGKDFALFFAVSDYSGTQYTMLENSISGVEALVKELKEVYGFQTKTYQDKTKGEIERILEQWQAKQFPEDGQLFVYFSGHGAFRNFNKTGYFIPKGSTDGDYGSYINLTELGNIITSIPCPHILLAIDACRSGTIDQEIAFQGDSDMKRPGDTSASQRHNIIAGQLRNRSRLLLTSGKNERTPTGVKYSPFTEGILSSLRRTYAEGGGLLTYHGLLADLEKVRPTPHYGTLYGHEDGGFVFVADEKTPAEEKELSVEDSEGNTYPILELAGKQWLGRNLNLEVLGSYCYDDDSANCREYGRLYTWAAAKEACKKLGAGWRLPEDEEVAELYQHIGDNKSVYKTLIKGGSSGFAALLGGAGDSDGGYVHLVRRERNS
ncbi:MAG: caspase family protein [Lewinellaceae bacterium]|nr:caspase family protein [Lewinellaceae bacterium]